MENNKLDVSPLPWTVEITGRDTPNGVAELRAYDGHSIVKAGGHLRRDDAQHIVRTAFERRLCIEYLKLLNMGAQDVSIADFLTGIGEWP